MLRLALKSVRHNPKRLILTAIAVALGVSLVSATHVITSALDSGISSQISEIYGSQDVIIVAGEESQTSTLEEAVVDEVSDLDGVDSAVGNVGTQMQTVFFDSNGERVGEAFGPPDLVSVLTGIEGIDAMNIVEGRAPEESGEIALSRESAAAVEAGLGDTVEIGTVEGRARMVVVGIGELGDDVSAFGARFSAVSFEDFQLIAGPDFGYTEIFVQVTEGSDVSAVAADASQQFPDLNVRTGEQYAADTTEEFQSILQYVDVFSLAFAFIAVFVGGYIIVNTFRILVTQRTRELGLLRAIGATGRQVRSLVLLEATAIGVIAGLLGVGAGWLLGWLLVTILSLVGFLPSLGAVALPLAAVIWGLATGLLITIVSAVLPAITASRISPMEALRDHTAVVRRGLRSRNIVGGALTLVGVLTVVVGLNGDLSRPYIYVGIGAVCIIIGVTLLAAQILAPLARFLRPAFTKLWKVDGTLASNNIQRESRRSANTAAALMIGVLLLAMTATFTESVKGLVRSELGAFENADLWVQPSMPLPISDQVVADLENTDGVDQISRFGFLSNTLVDGEEAFVGAYDAHNAEELYNFEADPPIAEIGDGALIPDWRVEEGTNVGDTLAITKDDQTFSVEVVGTHPGDFGDDVIVSWETASGWSDELLFGQAVLKGDGSLDEEELRDSVMETIEQSYPLLTVATPDEVLGFVNIIVDLVVGILYALMAGAVIIAMLGVTNTLLLSVTERTREIGLLRAVGMSRRSVKRMIRIESVVMALLGAVLGSILGVGLGVAILQALEEFGFTVIEVPWLYLAAFTILAILAGIVAALAPARRAAKLDILKAIATE